MEIMKIIQMRLMTIVRWAAMGGIAFHLFGYEMGILFILTVCTLSTELNS